MPGPTTEVLNEDIKEIKGEIRDIRTLQMSVQAYAHVIAMDVAVLKNVNGELAVIRIAAQNLAVDLSGFKGEVRLFMRLVTWIGALLMTVALSSGVAVIWWASNLTSELRQVASTVAKVEARLTALEGRIAGVEGRLTVIEAKVTPTPRPDSPNKGE